MSAILFKSLNNERTGNVITTSKEYPKSRHDYRSGMSK